MAERLIDGGFEEWTTVSDATYWDESTAGTSTIRKDSSTIKAGLYSCKITQDAGGNAVSVAQAVSLVAGRKYRFSCWYINIGAAETLAVVIRDSGSNVYLTSTAAWDGGLTQLTLPNSLTWREFSIEFTAHASYSSYHVLIGAQAMTSSHAFIDKVSLVSRDACGFLWDNKWDAGTLTASSAANYFPATNTRHRWYKRTWRSANLAVPDELVLDALAEVSADMFALRYDNLHSSSTVTIKAHNAANDWENAAVENALAVNSNTMVHVWGSAQSYRYWRLAMLDANNPSNYVEVGRCFLGPVFEPTRGAVIGGGMREQTDPSIIQMSDEGQTSTIKKTKYRTGGVQFSLLPESDKDQFEALYANVGEANSFFFVEDMGDPWHEAYYVEITSFEVVPRYASQYDVRIGMKESR